MQALTNLKERTQWAIDYVAEKFQMTTTQISKAVGSKPDTIYKYRTKVATPRINFLVKFCGIYGLNFQWISSGTWQPFPDADAIVMEQPVPDKAGKENAPDTSRDLSVPKPSGFEQNQKNKKP
jgi:hypothetical protein